MKPLLGLLLLALLVACGPAEPQENPDTRLTGTWVGAATFTDNCANPACRWPPSMNPPSVVLELTQAFNKVDGTTTLDLPQGEVLIAGNPCGPMTGSVELFDGTLEGQRLTLISFSGSVQQTWSLNVISDGLQGTFVSDAPGCGGLVSDDVSLARR